MYQNAWRVIPPPLLVTNSLSLFLPFNISGQNGNWIDDFSRCFIPYQLGLVVFELALIALRSGRDDSLANKSIME